MDSTALGQVRRFARKPRIGIRGLSRCAEVRTFASATWTTISTSLSLVLFATASFASDGVEPIATSMRAQARAGADVAVGDSALSQFDNPATLTLSPDVRLDGDAQLAIVSSHWAGPIDSVSSDRRHFGFSNGAVAWPLSDRLSLGTAFISRAGAGSSYRYKPLTFSSARRFKSDLKVASVPISLAYKVTDRLSVGVGGRVEVASARIDAPLGPVDASFGRGYAYGGGFQLGAHWQARDNLAFGVGYRSPTWFNDLDGGQGKLGGPGLRWPIKLGEAVAYDFKLPQRISAGLAWDAAPRLKLISEVRWINWKSSTLDDAETHTDVLGDLRIPLGYRDQWAFIQAAQIKMTDHWNLAFGYHYATQAVTSASLTPVSTAVPQHHLATGLWYETRRWWAGGAYAVSLPQTMSGPGYSRIPFGWDYGRGDLEQSVHTISVGFGIRW